jgi:hypothetical protein
MVRLEELAQAALSGDALELRSLTQAWLQENPRLDFCPIPQTTDREILTVAAALVELFAARAGQPAPDWSEGIGPLSAPRFLLRAASTMKRLRQLCEDESPAPLRRRNLFAPADFLRFA